MSKNCENGLCISNSLSSFKQIVIEQTYTLPLESPNIDSIVKSKGNVEILDSCIIKTAKGVSLEGYKLTGSKAFLDSVLNLEIEYVAKNSVQSVHGMKVKIPFKECVVISGKYNQFIKLIYSAFLEGLTVLKADDRHLYISATILITVEEN